VRVAFALVSLLVVVPTAAAEPAPPPAGPADDAPAPVASVRPLPPLEVAPLDHDMQFGIAVLPGTGYRVIVPYGDNINCGALDKRVCTHRLPFFLDAQLSFGFARHWDALVDLRFGVEQDFTQTHQFAAAPGFRYWIDPELPAKFFATIQLAVDATNQQNPAVKNTDLAFRNANGLMVEVMRNFGVYLQFGETIGFRRWMRFEIDGGFGLQARFP
jgi:hypothetical protein